MPRHFHRRFALLTSRLEAGDSTYSGALLPALGPLTGGATGAVTFGGAIVFAPLTRSAPVGPPPRAAMQLLQCLTF
jgi:hypothetical protein